MEEPKEEESSEEAKEAKTHMEEEHMDGTREETKEEIKEKAREYSLASVIIVERKDTARDIARNWEKAKEQMRKAREKDSKERVIIVVSSDIVPPTAGRAKAKEREEHTR
jgi:hypothetical protein